MAEKNETPSLGGFDVLSNMLTGKAGDGRLNMDDPPMMDPEVVKKELDEAEDEPKKIEEEIEEEEVEEVEEVEEEEEKPDDLETEDLTEYESDITAFLNSKLKEELGWELDDENAPKSVGELVEFMREMVEEASKPQYASKEIEEFDEFVKNGGSLREFYKATVENRVDVGNVNLENTFEQKLVLKEHYTNQGYSEDRINKMLERWENAGVLQEEAEDALELLKDYNEKTKQKLLETQKKDAALAEEQQQKFVSAVEDSIKKLDNVRGFKISDKERKELLDYILVPDASGITKYQKDYMSDIKNLLESAYFTKKGDVLLNKSKEQGRSDAVKNLHDKLKANKGNRGKQSGSHDSGKTSSGLSVLGSMLQGS